MLILNRFRMKKRTVRNEKELVVMCGCVCILGEIESKTLANGLASRAPRRVRERVKKKTDCYWWMVYGFK